MGRNMNYERKYIAWQSELEFMDTETWEEVWSVRSATIQTWSWQAYLQEGIQRLFLFSQKAERYMLQRMQLR